MTVHTHYVDGALRWYSDDARPDLRVQVTCPRCGADTEVTNAGKRYAWHTAVAICCTECRWTGGLSVELCELRDTSAKADASRLTRQDPYEAMAARRRQNRQKVTA